jgi:hypothetical protein
MKQMTLSMIAAAALMLIVARVQADDTTPIQRGPTAAFADVNGDGINDHAPDHDGDGIVNHLDADYKPAGLGLGRGAKGKFQDEDGDGINDLAPDDDGDGIPNGQDADFVRQAAGLQKGWGRWSGLMGGSAIAGKGTALSPQTQDSDGDGVINCLDDDYVPQSQVGTGRMTGRKAGRGRQVR